MKDIQAFLKKYEDSHLGGIYYKDKIVTIVRENIGNKKKGVRGLLRLWNYRKNFT